MFIDFHPPAWYNVVTKGYEVESIEKVAIELAVTPNLKKKKYL